MVCAGEFLDMNGDRSVRVEAISGNILRIRKDVERAFGSLLSKWHIWDVATRT